MGPFRLCFPFVCLLFSTSSRVNLVQLCNLRARAQLHWQRHGRRAHTLHPWLPNATQLPPGYLSDSSSFSSQHLSSILSQPLRTPSVRLSTAPTARSASSVSLPTNHYTEPSNGDSEVLRSDDLDSIDYVGDHGKPTTTRLYPSWHIEYDHENDAVIRYRLSAHEDAQPLSSHGSTDTLPRAAESEFRIMQWNVNGMNSSSSILLRDLRMGDFSAALLQEANTHYNTDYHLSHIPGYKSYGDVSRKTVILVKKEIPAEEIPLNLRSGGNNPEDTTYATAVLLRIQRRGRMTELLLISTYRSPNGSNCPGQVLHYLRQCKEWLKTHRPGFQLKDWIIGGDFNASHQAWGARRGTRRSDRDGARLHQLIHNRSDVEILNPRTNQPTRVRHDKVKRRTTLSWLDLTLCPPTLADDITWNVEELEKQSDHYQLHFSLPAKWKTPALDLMTLEETMWKLRDDPELWQLFQEEIERLWISLEPRISGIQRDLRLHKDHRMERISGLVEGMYHSAAHLVFGRKVKCEIWKKWIPKRAQFHSIQFHRFYRRFIKKRRRTHSDWRIYETLRRKRDYWMTYYKHRWLAQHFMTDRINGKDPWKIMNEARDINDNRGRRIPDLIDDDTGAILASTTRDKVGLINTYYHRFRDNAALPASWCWRRPALMPNRFCYYGDTLDERQMHRDHEFIPTNPEPELMPASDADDSITMDDRHDRYTDWIQNRTLRRWLRCKDEHRYWLSTLNARITANEVRRAISGFQNGKAQGPDEMDIQFLKRTGDVSQAIVLRLSNLMYKDWQVVPRRWKERWIVPLIKAGKQGNQLRELRPVSLTSYIAKILEKILVHRLSTYVLRLQLLSSVHFAYLRGRSTSDCLVYMLDRIQRNMRQGIRTHCIYFDFSSAFDTVQHSILLWKLEHQFFIKGPFLAFMAAFLRDRRSCVKMHGIYSEWLEDKVGVPQGGALSPLIYILYVDDLGVLNQIRGLHVAIFSDDLAIWTSSRLPQHAHEALQEGIYFTQWFCRLNGLIVNHGKTEYKVFTNRALHAHDILPFQLTGAIEPTRSGDMIQTATRTIDHNPDPIRYLGFWLDTRLNFRAHTAIVRKKVLANFHPIQNNFRRLWHVKADIIWTLYNSCCVSIFEYSAILWPLMQQQDRDIWTKLYKKIIRKCFKTVKGTNDIHLLHQLGTYPLDDRMNTIVSQYYSRMIRAPRSGQLHRLIRTDWWSFLTNSNAAEPLSVRRSRENTIIWHINAVAAKFKNDDHIFLRRLPGGNIDCIPNNMSHSSDLTHQWQQTELDPDEFTDTLFRQKWYGRDTDELLLFTDGSVKYRAGGYGSHLIHGDEYRSIINMQQQLHFYESCVQNQDCSRLDMPTRDRAQPLSNRCTIDFCESHAIHDGLHNLYRHLAALTANWREANAIPLDLRYVQPSPVLRDKNIQTLRIISDSLTVLKWIAGDYKIVHPTQKKLVEEIKWCAAMIEEEFGIRVVFQWTRSHTNDTRGNDYADTMAKQGYRSVDTRAARDNPLLYDEWSFYHMRGVLNRCYRHFDDKMESDLDVSLRSTRYSTMIKAEWCHGQEIMRRHKLQRHPAHSKRDSRYKIPAGIPWTDFFKKELQVLSRDAVRIIIGLRTGKNHLNYYMSDRLHLADSDRCFCGASGQDFEHIIEDCDDVLLHHRRLDLQRRVRSLYHDAWGFLRSNNPAVYPIWNPTMLDYSNGLTYLYPPYDIPLDIRGRILYETANFYRWVIGYQQEGVLLDRNLADHVSSGSESGVLPSGIG